MRNLVALVALLLSGVSAFAGSKPISTVKVPCNSYYQVLSPDGSQLAWRCKDRTVHVLNVKDQKELRVIPAAPGVNSLAYSSDGQWLALGFYNGNVEVASSKSLEPTHRWKASARRIDLLYFFPDGKTVIVGPTDADGQVWDLSGVPKLAATLPFEFGGMNACALSPDGKLLVVAGDDTVLRWYDTKTWKQTLENRNFLLETFALAFTADGKQVLAGGADARITVLDALAAKTLRQLPAEKGSYIVQLELFGAGPSAATVYLDDAGGKPPHGRVWDLATERSVALGSDKFPTCGAVVGDKLWLCNADGNTLTIAQYE